LELGGGIGSAGIPYVQLLLRVQTAQFLFPRSAMAQRAWDLLSARSVLFGMPWRECWMSEENPTDLHETLGGMIPALMWGNPNGKDRTPLLFFAL
jgi:hypothetical protein